MKFLIFDNIRRLDPELAWCIYAILGVVFLWLASLLYRWRRWACWTFVALGVVFWMVYMESWDRSRLFVRNVQNSFLKTAPKPVTPPKPLPEPTKPPIEDPEGHWHTDFSAIVHDPTWKTSRSEEYGIEFQYPRDCSLQYRSGVAQLSLTKRYVILELICAQGDAQVDVDHWRPDLLNLNTPEKWDFKSFARKQTSCAADGGDCSDDCEVLSKNTIGHPRFNGIRFNIRQMTDCAGPDENSSASVVTRQFVPAMYVFDISSPQNPGTVLTFQRLQRHGKPMSEELLLRIIATLKPLQQP